jgi:osmotically-inducible protein OsmY
MKRFPVKSLVAACAIALASSTLVAAETDEQLTDLWVKAKLTTTYTLNRQLNPFDIKTDVNDGVATLNGTVESDVERDLAEELARSVEGIHNVKNELTIDSAVTASQTGQTADSAERSFSRKVEDASLTARIKSQLLSNKNTGGLAIDVDTRNGKVTLSGRVDSDAEGELAEQIAHNTSGVRDVDNQLSVGGEEATLSGKAEREVRDTAESISDGWISAKVKSALMYNRGVDGTDIDVDTRDGVVTLRGRVGSETEGALASTIANGIKGVKSVHTELTAGDES